MNSLILLAILISTVSSSGHLRLDFTSSTDCAIQLSTDVLHAETFWLTMGESRTISFHSLYQKDTIKVTFTMDGGDAQEQIYQLKKTGTPQRDVFNFKDVAVLVEASFECDEGFIGSRCMKPRPTKPATTTSSTTTITTTTTTTTTTFPTSTIPRSTTVTTAPAPVQAQPSGNNSIFILALVVIVITLLIILLIICFLVTKSSQSTYIEPICESPEIKKKDVSLDSGFSSGSPRYTREPSTIIPISKF